MQSATIVPVSTSGILGPRIATLTAPAGPKKGDRMAFLFRLETADGEPADPPELTSAVPNWRSGDTIPLGAGRMMRVTCVRDDDADQPPVLVVEDMAQ